jgi:DNA modification methylase
MDDVTILYREISTLKPYARNPRKNDSVIDRMVASIQEFGFKIPILAASDGSVIDGHLRLKAAQRLRLESVPVIICDDWTNEQVKAFRLLVNRSVSWAEWDTELLKLELEDLKRFDYNLQLTGFDPEEIASLFAPGGTPGLTDDDTAPESPAAAVTMSGDRWVLGNHRLLCGDSISLDDVQRLMDGKLADLVFTDPPYNVAYSGRGELNSLGPIQNDDMCDADFDDFISRAFSCCCSAMKELAPIYVAHPDSKSAPKITFETHFARYFHKASTIIWLKQSAGMGWQDYRAQHEPILYGWKQGQGSHYFIDDRSKTTVWDIARDAQLTYTHPTQKPVALSLEAIQNSTKTGALVLDPFAGSGSTLIASEKTGRVARVMELDPKYCDVVIRRWQSFTGRLAKLDSNGMTFEEIAQIRSSGMGA